MTSSSVYNYEIKEKRKNLTFIRKQQKLQGKQLPSTGLKSTQKEAAREV